MNTERKYSIIVVTRNNAQGLERTLNSIRSLDYARKETIVVDGGWSSTKYLSEFGLDSQWVRP